MENSAVFAPMPSASDSTASALTSGVALREREADLQADIRNAIAIRRIGARRFGSSA